MIPNKLRNTGTHTTLINVKVAVSLFENAITGKGSSSPMRIFFKDDPDSDLEIIPYLEDRIQKMEKLIEKIMEKESSLRSP